MSLIAHIPCLYYDGNGKGVEIIRNLGSIVDAGISFGTGGPFNYFLQTNGVTANYKTEFASDIREFTISFWVKPSYTDTTWSDVVRFNIKKVSGSSTYFRMEFNGTAYYWFGNGISTDSGGIYAFGASDISANNWGHVAITFKSVRNIVYSNTYVNGIHKSSVQYDSGVPVNLIDGIQIGDSGSNNGISDLRVYDSILSTWELLDLQKRLMLSYSFDDNAPKNEFLTLKGNSIGSYGILTQDDNSTFRVTSSTTSTSTSHGLWIYMTNSTSLLQPSTQYVFSADVYNASNSADLRVHFEGGATLNNSNYMSSTRIVCTTKNQWVRIWGVFTTGSTQGTNQIMFYPNPYAGHFTDGYQLYRNIKIYKGSEYLGDNVCSDIVCDESSMGLHSNITKILYSRDSKVGNTSALFNGSNYMTVPKDVKLPKNFTVNFWATCDWPSFTGSFMSCTESGGWGVGYQAAINGHGFEVYTNGGYVGIDMQFNSFASGWHMITCSFDGRYLKGYVDSVLKSTYDIGTSGNNITYNANNTTFIGAEAGGDSINPTSNYFIGKIDKIQLYASVLGEDDISGLYKKRAYILNNSGVISSDVHEMENPTSFSVDKNGTIDLVRLSETGRKLRYIKIFCNGSTANQYNHLQFLKVCTVDGVEIPIVNSYGSTSPRVKKTIVLGSCNENSTDCSATIVFDLGNVYNIASCTMARYYADSRKYYQQAVYGSVDNVNWFDIYYSGNTGANGSNDDTNLYTETASGRTWLLGSDVCAFTQNGAIVTDMFKEI